MEPKIESVYGPRAVRPSAAGEPLAPVASPAERAIERPIPGFDTFDRLELHAGAAVLQAHAKFRISRESGIVSIEIINSITNEVVREIPSEQVVRIADELQSYLDAGKLPRPGSEV